jgi:hypothetical protein
MHTNAQLFEALAHKNFSAATAAIQSGADINGRTAIGEGVWSFVIPAGVDAVRMALRMRADPNALDGAQRTSLYWAVQANVAEIAKALVQSGARMDEQTSDGFNVIHEAAMAGHAEVLGALIVAAADSVLVAPNVLGRTPLAEAIEGGNETCVRLIQTELGRRGLQKGTRLNS